MRRVHGNHRNRAICVTPVSAVAGKDVDARKPGTLKNTRTDASGDKPPSADSVSNSVI
jgi:hypothetical protein